MLLVVDNGSIYTKNLTDFLNEKNISFHWGIVHKKIFYDERGNLTLHFIKKINEINSKVITYSIKNNIKLLGICYGAEILALTLGGTIRKISSLQKGNETIKILKENPISDNSLDVFESHGFEISKLPSVLVALAESEHCQYEIIQYEKKPIFGTQFHPEMSQDGHDLIEKFCSL